jgi:hypothetical protein
MQIIERGGGGGGKERRGKEHIYWLVADTYKISILSLALRDCK